MIRPACHEWGPIALDEFEIFTVYAQPSDFPWHYVVRRFLVAPHGEARATYEYMLAPTLEAARKLVPEGLYRQVRHQSDDPVIVECWF